MSIARRFRGAGRQAIRVLTEPLGAILMYHRIGPTTDDPFDLAVTPENFRSQLLEARRRGFTTRTASEMADRIGQGRLPRLSLCITLDDGYADNLRNAYPILRELRMPATIFTVAGAVGSDDEFWWDAVERIFLSPGVLPERLELPTKDRSRSIDLGEGALYSGADRLRHQDWSAERAPPTPRHAAMMEVYAALSAMSPRERAAALPVMCAWAGVEGGARETHRAMRADELAALARDPLIEIAAHTVLHPRLPELPRAEQRAEVERSRTMLEAIVGRPVTGFSYPHGQFDEVTLDLVRAAGYRYACTSDQRPLRRNEDLHALPRIVAPNVAGAVFGEEVLSRVAPGALGMWKGLSSGRRPGSPSDQPPAR